MASGATPISTSDLVVEDDGSAFINVIAPDANETGVLFGNPGHNASGGIVYNNSSTPLGLAFRTNGNATRAVITDEGDMGIGDPTPNAKLHVSEGASGSTYNTGSDLLIEDDAASYLQIATPVANESGIISSTNSVSMRGAVLFMPDSSVQIRAHNTAKLTVDKNGNTTTVGEIRRTSTGNANMVPICYGGIDAAGNILNAGSGNFTVTITPPGYYEITITGESYSNTGFPTVVTPVSSNPRFISIGSSGGKLVVRTWTAAAALVDTIFNFVIYKP